MPLACSNGALREVVELLAMDIGAGGDHIICRGGGDRDKCCGSLCGPLRDLDSGRAYTCRRLDIGLLLSWLVLPRTEAAMKEM
jgi:hypothetical protein